MGRCAWARNPLALAYHDREWGAPLRNERKPFALLILESVPARTEVSDALSKDLKKRGFKFVGSTIMYAFMQAVGMVNDHTTDCCRWKKLR